LEFPTCVGIRGHMKRYLKKCKEKGKEDEKECQRQRKTKECGRK